MFRQVLPLARRTLFQNNVAGFCLFKAYMDPHKHNTMNHNIHNVYIELYDAGQYPEHVVNQSEPPRTYESQVYSLLVNSLNASHPDLTVEYLQKNAHRDWNDALRRLYPNRTLPNNQVNFQSLYGGILNKLAFNIIVKESKWTWIREQEERLKFSTKFFQDNKVSSVEQFFQAYNLMIQTLTSVSNFGLAKDIPHDNTYLEKAVEAESRNEEPVGIKELDEGSPNFINRMMAAIHRV